MKAKLTLSISPQAIRRAKAAARRRGVPLSRLVEEHFDRLSTPDAGERFLAKWQGAFRLPDGIDQDPRAAAIIAKHIR
jgi:hypothetical protein